MENKYVIIADTCVDLNKEQRALYGIETPIAGSVIFPNGEAKTADTDWENMTHEEFFHSMENKAVYKSTLPNPYEVVQACEPFFAAGKDILAVTLSGGISGTYNSFMNVKKELEEKYPGRKMLVVDSRRYSAGIGILAIYASKNREKGLSVEENFEWLEERKLGNHQIGILDDMIYLGRSGRISKFKAFMGNMVGVKPMADFDNVTGFPVVLGKARGYKKAYKNIISYIKNTIDFSYGNTIVITNSIRPKQAEEIKELIKAEFPQAEIVMCKVGQACGVNIGPGLVVAFYLGKKTSDGCVEEINLLNAINKGEIE